MAADKPRLGFLYLTDLRNRTADVIQSLEMCDALGSVFRLRFYHPAITGNRFRRELDYWAIDAKWERRRLAAFGPNRRGWLDFPNRSAFLAQALLDLSVRPVDVIYTRDPSLLYFLSAMPACLRPRAPIIYEAHKLYHRVSSRVASPAGEKRALVLATQVIAISSGVREDLVALGLDPSRIDVLPLGVKLKSFQGKEDKNSLKLKLGLDPARPVVVYSGSWGEWKGVETLINAFAELARTDTNALLLLIGVPGPVTAALKAKCAVLGLGQDRVMVHSHLPRRELVAWLRASDIGVVPNSDTLFSARYTSPLKVFEYLAAGLAVVASDVPALRALVSEQEAVFAKPGDAVDMANKLGRLLRSDADRQNRQLAARRRASAFDYAVRAESILAIYRDLCRPSKNR